MRSTTICLFLSLLAAAQAHAVKSVTVEQLSGEVGSFSKKSDSKTAEKLHDLKLTERLNANKLAAFEAALPGPESRRALVELADQAEFLDPPPAELPNRPAPSVPQQREIIAESIDYVEATLHRLPNLFANRDTIRFEDVPPGLRDESTDTIVPYQPLHPVSRSMETVHYQDGQELIQKQAAQPGGSDSMTTGMMTSGEFGPIFPVVYGDLPKGNLRWSHWEQGKAGLESVFRFDVPKAASHYRVEFCCIKDGLLFQEFSAYHGELTIDPTNGTILRMTLIADPEKGAEIAEAELMVEYGPVELGGRKYFCPLRSISVSRGPRQFDRVAPVRKISSMDRATSPDETGEGAPLQTMLNETTFDNYHLFRADAQILSANDSEAGSIANAPADASSNSPKAPSVTPAPQENDISGSSAQAAPVGPPAAQVPSSTTAGAMGETPSPAEATSATQALSTSQPTPPSPTSSMAEIAVAAPAPFPDTGQTASGPSSFSLSLNVRYVDVDVSALDNRGHAAGGLSMKDFEVYDNGRRQSLRSLSRVDGSASPMAQGPAATVPAAVYSNRPEGLGGDPAAQPVRAQELASSTVLLLDESSIGFADLNYAREQILKFIDRLAGSEPVGLYLRTGPSFQILAEQTTDHAALRSVLRKWMPTAQELARAQEEETRNRQHFDYVDSTSEMQYVNGNMGGTNAPAGDALSTNATPDPKISQEGQNLQRDALAALMGVAVNLNAVPGHKNLVWVASDNVLANWSDQATGNPRGPDAMDAFDIGIEEALNDAHVSLYPLDVSQLEATATDASLENRTVEQNPAIPTEFPNMADGAIGGREKAGMQRNSLAIRPAVQHLALATGGRSFRRASDMVGELDSVIADGNATYLLSFSPDVQPDGKYHQIKITVPTRPGIRLRYRAGYLYSKEPSTLKDRMAQAVWQPQDESEIGISAHWDHTSQGPAISLSIAGSDVGLAQKGDLWTDKLDIFLVQRDDTGTRAQAKEQALVLNLKPETYQKVLHDGIPFAEYVEHKQNFGTTRIIVVDENSGHIGSVTLPVMQERANP